MLNGSSVENDVPPPYQAAVGPCQLDSRFDFSPSIPPHVLLAAQRDFQHSQNPEFWGTRVSRFGTYQPITHFFGQQLHETVGGGSISSGSDGDEQIQGNGWAAWIMWLAKMMQARPLTGNSRNLGAYLMDRGMEELIAW